MLLCLGTAVWAQAPRKVILEDFTGTWCGFCPRGTTTMNNTLAAYPNVIGMAVHNGSSNAMAIGNIYANTLDDVNTYGYPGGMVDRWKFPQQSNLVFSTSVWTSYSYNRTNVTSPVNISIASTFNSVTRQCDVTVTASFVGAATAYSGGDFRMSAILVEDGITGTGVGYNQTNYLGQGCSSPDPNSPWYTFPCTIVGFVHDHVARYNMAGGTAAQAWGLSGVVPNSVSAGQSFTHTFTYTLPTAWNDQKMKVVAFVSNYHPTNVNQRDILNANETIDLNSTVGVNEITDGNLIGSHSCYPNPFNPNKIDLAHVKFQLNKADNVSVKFFNALGQEIITLVDRDLTPGEHIFYWDARTKNGDFSENGVYIYEIRSSEGAISGKMLLNRE